MLFLISLYIFMRKTLFCRSPPSKRLLRSHRLELGPVPAPKASAGKGGSDSRGRSLPNHGGRLRSAIWYSQLGFLELNGILLEQPPGSA